MYKNMTKYENPQKPPYVEKKKCNLHNLRYDFLQLIDQFYVV
jgi:hypothetical protein